MTQTAAAGTHALLVALDPRVEDDLPEVKYTFSTLLAIAGYACHFVWAGPGVVADIAYEGVSATDARLRIPYAGRSFRQATRHKATALGEVDGMPWLFFDNEATGTSAPGQWPSDAVFAAYWLLTGAPETSWPRDRWDNLGADAFVLVRDGVLADAPVSRWGQLLRRTFDSPQRPAASLPWVHPAQAAFVFTHDVDYPEIIRWIEAPRRLLRGGRGAFSRATEVLRGTNHFWTFMEWVDMQARVGARPTFYFMARRGSLYHYARGRPDDFYDVRTPRFRELFAQLKDAGCEIGLHASYLAHRSAEALRVEAERITHVAGVSTPGNRHHYWHLDPADPNETLRRHELAGLAYDSSLGLEFFPGFRRGICHPFHVFHPGERRALDIVQLPPTWMDDHFDRRRTRNRITDADAVARQLLATLRATHGVGVVDYHSRGMNADFYPRYGPWLAGFVEREFDASLAMRTPHEVVREFREYETRLGQAQCDEAIPRHPLSTRRIHLEVSRVTQADAREVAALHAELFGDSDYNGHSVAAMGSEFLADVFYGLNVDNSDLHALVARADGRVVGFSVYATDRERALSFATRRHPAAVVWGTLRALARRPAAIGTVLHNLRYASGEEHPFLHDVPGWWIVAGVHPDARTARFEARAEARVAARLFDHMEADMLDRRCGAWYGVVRPDNVAINRFLQRRGAVERGIAVAQGLEMRYYVKRFPGADPAGQ